MVRSFGMAQDRLGSPRTDDNASRFGHLTVRPELVEGRLGIFNFVREISQSILDGYESARRCATVFNQQGKYDHLHSVFRNLMAVDQALARRHQFFDESAVAAWMRAPMPMGAQVQYSFARFGRWPWLGERHQRVVAAKPIVALHSGRVHQSAIGHEN